MVYYLLTTSLPARSPAAGGSGLPRSSATPCHARVTEQSVYVPPPVRADRSRLESAVARLQDEEVEQFAQYDGVCSVCHSPYYGLLDESRVTIVQALTGRGLVEALCGSQRSAEVTSVHGVSSRHTVWRLTAYEIRMNIVRSGLWTQDQLLRSGGLFNQHELEVNERSFFNIRPARCECDFGTPTASEYDLHEFEAAVEQLARTTTRRTGGYPSVMTEVEEDFILGNPVRTGYRRRSADAILRRKMKKKNRKLRPIQSGITYVVRSKPRLQTLPCADGVEVVLHFETGVCLHRPRRNSRRLRPRPDPSVNPNFKPLRGYGLPAHTKYRYFFRKTGIWNHSVHHPLPGDPGYRPR